MTKMEKEFQLFFAFLAYLNLKVHNRKRHTFSQYIFVKSHEIKLKCPKFFPFVYSESYVSRIFKERKNIQSLLSDLILICIHTYEINDSFLTKNKELLIFSQQFDCTINHTCLIKQKFYKRTTCRCK